MSNPLPQTLLLRYEWITQLRHNGQRKCEGCLRQIENGCDWDFDDPRVRVCALGLLQEILVLRDIHPVGGLGGMMRAVGLHDSNAQQIANRNDGTKGFHKHTFAELADLIESW